MLLDYFYPETTAPVVKPTGGHFIPEKHHKHFQAALKKQREALEAREAEKLAQRQDIRLQLEKALHPERFVEIAKPQEEAKKVEAKPLKPAQRANLEKQLREIEIELAAIRIESERKALEAKRAREEDDIQALLMAENAVAEEFARYLKKIQ